MRAQLTKDVLVIGAGFAGSVVARELAQAGYGVTVIEKRDHLGGNCHSAQDDTTGVTVHTYGPHIFNTNDREVWEYVGQFCTLMPFINRVKAVNSHGVFSFPINLHTINQFFHTNLNPEQARDLIDSRRNKRITEPQNLEEQALSVVGAELYEAFIRDYTVKQWGRSPLEIPASFLSRMPVRFNYDDNYYLTKLQGIPQNGYTEIFERMLSHPNIRVELGVDFLAMRDAEQAAKYIFFTGPIDSFFAHRLGRLSYRTVEFERQYGLGDLQGNAIINHTDMTHRFTRTHEHKHFTPWRRFERSVLITEYSKETGPEDTPFYPVRTFADKVLLDQYQSEAALLKKVTFLGRLGTYKYLTMDGTIRQALDVAHEWLERNR